MYHMHQKLEDRMKNLIFINGTMGVGKTTTCNELQKILSPSVFLDGDWCWNMTPFIITDETKKIVNDNICHFLNNFLCCSEFQNIIFCWVMHKQTIIDDILGNLNLVNTHYHLFTLTISEQSLQKRLVNDISIGLRTNDTLLESCNRLPLYDKIDSIKIDVSEITAKEAAKVIASYIT